MKINAVTKNTVRFTKRSPRLLSVLALCLLLVIIIPFSQSSVSAADESKPRLVDNAGIVQDSRESEILALLDSYSAAHDIDIVVLTESSLGFKSAQEYADDYFDYNGYGKGTDRSGILFLIGTENRDWYMSTRGRAISYINDWSIDCIFGAIQEKGYLDEGNEDYAAAFKEFALLVDDFLTQAEAGKPYGYFNVPKQFITAGDYAAAVVFAVIIAAVISLIIVLVMKSKLKSVGFKSGAADYVRRGSLNITGSRDIFLYHTIRKVPRQQSSGSGGTHISSSGASHGGHGGHF